LNHHVSPHLVYARSEQLYYTNNLSEPCNTLSPRNSTLLTADTILCCTKILFPTDDFRFLFHTKIIIPCSSRAPFVPPKGKGKGKSHPRTGHKGPDGEQMYSSTLPSTSALDGVGGQRHTSSRFTPGKDPVPIV